MAIEKFERAVFAAGCFWGVEATLQKVPGVAHTRVGYTGGHAANPTYEAVCGGQTGHAEAVEVVFDPAVVSYEEVLARFWALHDPTQVNRQGPDVGTQYRSAIFVADERQRAAAEASLAERQRALSHPIATEIAAAGTFWAAEEYHQCYVQKRRRFF